MLKKVMSAYCCYEKGLDKLSSLFSLAIRLYLAYVFFKSGLVKIQSWDSTITLFENEYAVPLLPPHIAAYLGTAAELVLPVFFVLGLGSRLMAIPFFIFNLTAALSYPDISPAGIKDHILWGSLMLVILFYGPGCISLDAWLRKRCASHCTNK